MTRDDLAKMYEKANGWSPAAFVNTMDDLERFANLVAAHEREACAKLFDAYLLTSDPGPLRARGNDAP